MRDDIVDGSFGVKFAPARNTIIVLNALFPLNRGGLRPNLAYTRDRTYVLKRSEFGELVSGELGTASGRFGAPRPLAYWRESEGFHAETRTTARVRGTALNVANALGNDADPD